METRIEMENINPRNIYSHPPPNNYPDFDAERLSYRRRLFKAARNGDWEAAKVIFERDGLAKTAEIGMGLNALHVAAFYDQLEFVEKLVSLLSPEELQLPNYVGDTALHFAAMAASVKTAKVMVDKNPGLPQVLNASHGTPCHFAAKWRKPSKNKDMLEYLYSVTDKELLCTGPSALEPIMAIIDSGSYDIGLDLLEFNPELAVTTSPSGWSVLRLLATKPYAFASGSKLSLWKGLIYPWMNNVFTRPQKHSDALKLVHFICCELEKKSYSDLRHFFSYTIGGSILHSAIEHGVFELLEVCLNYFPDLAWIRPPEEKLLLHAAIEHRRKRIFDHILCFLGEGSGMFAQTITAGENNILHLAAKLAPWRQLHLVPGPAFQIQRELQWFKAVDALVYDVQRAQKNDENKTPRELFFKEHETLLSSAKEWMKDTSNSCMLVATLVTTVAFAAMITVPGGNDDKSGMPILSKENLFLAFSVSNAVSMISAAISLLMFLSVQMSRYTEEDFLESLPKLLLKGLLSLFIAVATMMIAFGTGLGMAFQTRLKWDYIPITILACIPAILFTRMHLPLLLQTFIFTSGPGIFGGRRGPKTLWWLEKMIRRLLPDDDHMA